MWGYVLAHTSDGLFRALEESASVLTDQKILPGKQSESCFHMSSKRKLENHLLIHLNICCPITAGFFDNSKATLI